VAFLAVAAAALLFAAVAAWQVLRTPFPGLFTEPTLVVNGLGDRSWPGYAAGLRFPQRLLTVDGTPLTRPTALIGALSDYQVGDVVVLGVQDPVSGDRLERTVRLTRLPAEAVVDFFLLPNLLGWAFLIVGAWALRAAPREEGLYVFVALCAALCLVMGLLFDLFTTHYFWWAWVASVPMAGSVALHLALVFPQRIRHLDRVRWLLLLAYLPGVAAAIAGVVATTHWERPIAYFDPWFWGMVWAGIGVSGLVLLTLARRFMSPSPLVRAQARTVLWGTVLGFGPYVAWTMATRGLGVLFPPLLILPWMTLFPLSVAYTLLRHRALDIDWILRRAATYILLAVVIVVLYLLIYWGAVWFISSPLPPAHPTVLVVFALLVAVGLHPARVVIQRILDRLVLGRRTTPEQALRDFCQCVTTARTAAEVAEMLGETLQHALAPRYALLYLLDEKTGQYTPQPLVGTAPLLPVFRSDSSLARLLTTRTQFLYLDDEAEWPAILVRERERLAGLGPALYTPLERWGWLTVGPTRAQRFRAADVQLLEALTPQLVAALERVRLISDLERRVAELETLRRIAQSAGYSVELDDLLELIYTQTSRILDTTNFYIALHDPETHTFRFAFYVDNGERRYPDDIWSDTHGLTGVIIRSGRPIVTDDYLAECRRQGVQPGGKPGTAWMGMPLISRDQVVGVINISSVDPDLIYTEEQIQTFKAIADQVAAILDKTRLYQEMERRARQLEALNEVGNVITSTLELRVTLDLIMRKAIDLLQAEAGSLLLMDEETGELVFEVTSGPRTADLMGTRLSVDTGIVGQVAREAQPVIVDDVQRDGRWFSGVDERSDFITRTIICVPMIARGRVIGVIELLNRRDGKPFDTEDQRLLTAFAANAAIAIENARLFTMTDQALAARVDELSMMQRIDRELNATLDYHRVMEITLEWALRTTGADKGLVAVIAEQDDRRGLRFLASQGYPQESVDARRDELWPLEAGLIGRVLRTGRPELVIDVGDDPDYVPLVEGMAAQLTVPICREEQIVGVIVLESYEGDRLNQEALDFVVRLADHAAMAIENARLFEAIQAANNAKTEFVSFVSHELKQPMTSIKGYADLLTRGTGGELNEMQRSLLEVIRSSVARMETLVQDLLDISRIEAGRLRLEIGPVDLGEAVAEVVRAVQRQVEAKGQSLEVQLPDALPAVAADRNRLLQILTNLISNAYKYTPEGGRIRVAARLANGFVSCAICDTGIGLTDEEQQRLFTKYFRSPHPAVRSVPGTGLGLVITKSLVELQGGQIGLESAPGVGSTFTFTLPVAVGGGDGQ